MREKRLGRFSTPDFKNKFRAVRDLQRARSAKFPAQLATSAEREVPRAGFFRVSYEKKTAWPFFNSRLQK